MNIGLWAVQDEQPIPLSSTNYCITASAGLIGRSIKEIILNKTKLSLLNGQNG
jgi:hypothetical protein